MATRDDKLLAEADAADLQALEPDARQKYKWRDLADPAVMAWFVKRVVRHMCPGHVEPKAALDPVEVRANLAFLLMDERVDKVEVLNCGATDTQLWERARTLMQRGFDVLATEETNPHRETLLRVTTKEIKFAGVEDRVRYDENLGRFELCVRIAHKTDVNKAQMTALLARPLTPNIAGGAALGNNNFHPHVMTLGQCCLGDYGGRTYALATYGNLPATLDMILGVLFTYNSQNPYRHMYDWRTTRCDYCGNTRRGRAESRLPCAVCGAATCDVCAGQYQSATGCKCASSPTATSYRAHPHCASLCNDCATPVCRTCTPNLPGVTVPLCGNCRAECAECKTVVRRRVLSSGVCPACRVYTQCCGSRVAKSVAIRVTDRVGNPVFRCANCTAQCTNAACRCWFNPRQARVATGVCNSCVTRCRTCNAYFDLAARVRVPGHGTTLRRRTTECQSCFEGRLTAVGVDVDACKAGRGPKVQAAAVQPAAEQPTSLSAPASADPSSTPDLQRTLREMFGVSSPEEFMAKAFPG